jgi:hypothetical protein
MEKASRNQTIFSSKPVGVTWIFPSNKWLNRLKLLERLSQQLEQYPPERGLDGVDAAVEAALAEHLLHVAELVEEQAGLV